MATPDAAVLIRALALGERSGFDDRHWQVLQRTGTSHLVAVSGLHIGMIAAMASSFTIAVALFVARKGGLDLSSHAALVWSVALTTVVWVVVTFLTRPADTETLRRFYRKVRPAGRG